jgi:hypothetical protein
MFLNMAVLQGGVVRPSPNPQAGGPHLVGCPRLLIQFICSYPPYQRPFLYPQPEDAPCRGDRDPLTWKIANYRPISISSSFSKILEKVTYNQLQEHLNKHGILAEEQFAFRADSTTNKAVYKLIN